MWRGYVLTYNVDVVLIPLPFSFLHENLIWIDFFLCNIRNSNSQTCGSRCSAAPHIVFTGMLCRQPTTDNRIRKGSKPLVLYLLFKFDISILLASYYIITLQKMFRLPCQFIQKIERFVCAFLSCIFKGWGRSIAVVVFKEVWKCLRRVMLACRAILKRSTKNV